MYILSYFGLFLGLIVLTVLLTWHGILDIFNLLLTSGWNLLLLPFAWVPCLITATFSWRFLFPGSRVPSFLHLCLANWMGRAVNTLLPVATIGGEIAKARLITLWGSSGVDASASAVVDKTVQAIAVIPWGLIGIILMVCLASDNSIVIPILTGFLLLSIGIGGFILVQHAGMFAKLTGLVEKFISPDNLAKMSNNAKEVDRLVIDIYNNRHQFARSVLWKTVSLILETAEAWLACYFLGHSITLVEAMMIRSLTSTLNNIAFFIPNGYGIQEGGYIMAGSLVGLTPEFSLALSLATRIRELCIDLPGVLTWQHLESKYYLQKKQLVSEN